MSDHIDHLHHHGVDKESFTPLPKHVHNIKKWKRYFFFSLLPLLVVLISAVGYLQYRELSKEKGSIGTTSDVIQPTQTPVPSFVYQPKNNTSVPIDWELNKSQTCGISLFTPPAEEPYIIPRDPNTLPSARDEEGNYWIYEEFDAELFMFRHLVRAIFKNPEALGSGYVSSAVEIFCANNESGYTTDSLMKKLETDLDDNFSIVQIKETIDDTRWELPVKIVRFQGGMFGNEQYYLFATQTHIYLIRAYGMSSNIDVTSVRDQIFFNLGFE